jgi:hypothetical protein
LSLHDKGQESPVLLKAGRNWPSLFGKGRETLLPAETCLRMPQEEEGKRSEHWSISIDNKKIDVLAYRHKKMREGNSREDAARL